MSHSAAAAVPAKIVLHEVKYSLPEMLEELKMERVQGSFATDKIDQNEIKKFFKPKTPRRVKSK